MHETVTPAVATSAASQQADLAPANPWTWWSVDDVAAAVGCPPHQVRHACRRGRLSQASKQGGAWRIPQQLLCPRGGQPGEAAAIWQRLVRRPKARPVGAPIGWCDPFFRAYLTQELAAYHLTREYHSDLLDVRFVTQDPVMDEHYHREVSWDQCSIPYPVLTLADGRRLALGPMELQSMYIPLQRARGRVAVAGLKTGYFALRAARRKQVRKVEVWEESASLIAWFTEFIAHRRERAKIVIHHGDPRRTLAWCRGVYDMAFVDLYPEPLDVAMLDDRWRFGLVADDVFLWTEDRVRLEAWLTGWDVNLRPDEAWLIEVAKQYTTAADWNWRWHTDDMACSDQEVFDRWRDTFARGW